MIAALVRGRYELIPGDYADAQQACMHACIPQRTHRWDILRACRARRCDSSNVVRRGSILETAFLPSGDGESKNKSNIIELESGAGPS